MIPDEEIDRVREAADIVAIIGEYVSLKRVGTTFRGPCPFHQGTHRNFSVDPRRKGYKCFKCGEGGDVFTFLRKRLGVDWPTAVRMAAERSGIELREVQSRREGPDPREPLWEVNAAAQDYFARMLWDDSRGAAAREYLGQRALDQAIAERFGLGFAPYEPDLLRVHLADLGFEDERQLEAGLLVRRQESEQLRPRFRGRLIFPIYDVSERVVGFGGRLLGPGEPKYLNSAESPTFVKGKLLYGLNWARNAIRKSDRVLLVEGYVDLVRLASAGIEEVVAPLGTALTDEQAELIVRYSRNVFLLYDSDKAGLKATFRAGDVLLSRGASVRVVTLPAGEDPDTFVRSHGQAGLEKLIGQALDVFERKIQLLQRGAWFNDLHRRRRAIDLLLPTIRAASDPVTRDMYVGRAAEASGIDRNVMNDEVANPANGRRARVRHEPAMDRQVSPAQPSQRPRPRAPRATGRGSSAERELVRVMLVQRSAVERVAERIGPADFRDPYFREIYQVLSETDHEASIEEIALALSGDAVPVLQELLTGADAVQDVDRIISDCISRLEERNLEERNAEIQRLMTAATDAEKNRLVQEKQENREEILRLRQGRELR